MPLFGKKDKDEKKGSPGKGYPTQQPAYPTQLQAYPTQQPSYAMPHPAYPGQQATQPQAQDLPPPYSPYPQTAPAGAAGGYPQYTMGASPQQPMGAYPQQPMGAYPQQPMGVYPQQPMGAYPQPQLGAYAGPIAVPGGAFDSGARFGAGATPNIPPPPPGSLPNMAQVASSQGQTVVVNQEKSSWLTGGSGGGITFW